MTFLLVLAGLACLVLGGEFLVRGAVAAATVLGISPLVIGLTLIGFGTSAPELVTSLQAAISGAPGIAIGNVVGSNIGNVLLILGITALVGPLVVTPEAFRRDGAVLAGATLAVLCIVLLGEIGRGAGAALVASLIGYLAYTVLTERRSPSPAAPVYEGEAGIKVVSLRPIWQSLVIAALGLAVTILGARLLVAGAVDLAARAGLSETLIGLTIVAIGTSLPELVTSLVAVLRREGDVALGNIIGSNIFNILGILGLTALLKPLPVPEEIARLDIWVLLVATLTLLLFARTGWRLARREGAALLMLYIGYLAVLIGGA